MAERLTETQRMERRVRDAIVSLESLLKPSSASGRGNVTVLADLMKRAEESSVVDGLPRGGGEGRVSGTSEGDPTLSAFLARESDVCARCNNGSVTLVSGKVVECRFCGGSGRRWADPVADAVAAIKSHVLYVSRHTKLVDRERAKIRASVPQRGRTSSLQGSCIVCGAWVTGTAEDRLKRGMDNACYLAWGSWKMRHGESDDPGADFFAFTIWRRDYLEARERAEQAAAEAERRTKR